MVIQRYQTAPVVGGPSREILFDSLRLFKEKRQVEFVVKYPNEQVAQGKIPVLVLAIIAGTQDNWYIWGWDMTPGDMADRSLRVTYDATHRAGLAQFLLEKDLANLMPTGLEAPYTVQ